MAVRPFAAALLTLTIAGAAAPALTAGPTASAAAPSAVQGTGGSIGWDLPGADSIGWDTPSPRSIGWDAPPVDDLAGRV
ncbi:hypothetical protein [Kitasatospora sp. NPDC096204]|uniref:hypothetical protein n=1 Tax=Kitasatospora sp. NPDC096204 TaxID=3364094 RepID=UPI00382DE173